MFKWPNTRTIENDTLSILIQSVENIFQAHIQQTQIPSKDIAVVISADLLNQYQLSMLDIGSFFHNYHRTTVCWTASK